MFSTKLFHVVAVLALSSIGCAQLHHVMLSDVESRGGNPDKIDVKVSEMTVDFREIGKLSKNLGRGSKAGNRLDDAVDTYTSLFQFGPSTGTPVFNGEYGSVALDEMKSKCKNGYLSNILSLREARQYPVIKGEVIRIQALCYSR